MTKYIVEHLEDELYEWCFIEYRSISSVVGKDNLVITNLKSRQDRERLSGFCEARKESVLDLGLKNACLLDMDAEKELSPSDSFDCLVFGGILGDHPPKRRTAKFLAGLNAELRHLGKLQMPTDNAVLAAKMVVSGKPLSEICFIDSPSFAIEDGLDLELPFRFVAVKGKPFMSSELLEHIKKSGF